MEDPDPAAGRPLRHGRGDHGDRPSLGVRHRIDHEEGADPPVGVRRQGGPDPSAEGGGITADAWSDTNVVEAPPVVCDGRYRVAFVPIGRHMDQDRLTSGQAWVQFCLVEGKRHRRFAAVLRDSRWRLDLQFAAVGVDVR